MEITVSTTHSYLGFDPGGINSFGWATLQIEATGAVAGLITGVVSTAPDAIYAASKGLDGGVPTAVGIDAPLFWVESGDRRADAAIRKRVVAAGGQSGTVSSVNSLRGACVVQGVLTARLVSSKWESTLITESHPKALLRLYPDAGAFVSAHVPSISTEHERDAVLSAYAAWAAASAWQGWRNLVIDETRPFFPGGDTVQYWFP